MGYTYLEHWLGGNRKGLRCAERDATDGEGANGSAPEQEEGTHTYTGAGFRAGVPPVSRFMRLYITEL